MLSESRDTLPLSESAISTEINEIDEALIHASATRNKSEFSQAQREIVEQFIDELLDTRLELKNAES
jgi:excinuclease UvrABC helicase subunit UvrB